VRPVVAGDSGQLNLAGDVVLADVSILVFNLAALVGEYGFDLVVGCAAERGLGVHLIQARCHSLLVQVIQARVPLADERSRLGALEGSGRDQRAAGAVAGQHHSSGQVAALGPHAFAPLDILVGGKAGAVAVVGRAVHQPDVLGYIIRGRLDKLVALVGAGSRLVGTLAGSHPLINGHVAVAAHILLRLDALAVLVHQLVDPEGSGVVLDGLVGRIDPGMGVGISLLQNANVAGACEGHIGLHGRAVLVQINGTLFVDLLGEGVLLGHGGSGDGVDGLGLLRPFCAVVYGAVAGQGEARRLMLG